MKIRMAYVQENQAHTKTRANALGEQNSILKHMWLPQLSPEGVSVD